MIQLSRVLCVLLILGVAALPADARAQSVLDRQATGVLEMMGNNGLSKRAERDGNLRQGEAIEMVIDVAAGKDIVLTGFCDQDCSDLDLRVSKDGSMLGEDVLDDDAPVVRLQNYAGGTLRVRVEMPGCSVAPCGFRVMVFGR